MSRCLAAVLLVVFAAIAPASAQEPQGLLPRSLALAAENALPPAQPVSFIRTEAPAPVKPTVEPASLSVRQRPLTLDVLCVSYAALQAIDLHTTFRALDNGAREANPLIGGFSSNKAAMIGVKAGMTAGTIYLVRKAGVKNRLASTIMMAAMNSAYAIIAAHNYRVANALR